MLIDILKKRFTAKWWSDRDVEENKLNYICNCIYNSPSKNGKYAYEVIIVKDQSVKDWLYWDSTYCIDGVREKKGPIGNRRYNGQVLAPLVFVWIADNKDRETYNDCVVSSTVAMLAAQEQSLQTGFNGCLDEIGTADRLGRTGCYATIMLGIGYIDQVDSCITRPVLKGEIQHGFDYGNLDLKITESPNRRNKPDQEELITIYSKD